MLNHTMFYTRAHTHTHMSVFGGTFSYHRHSVTYNIERLKNRSFLTQHPHACRNFWSFCIQIISFESRCVIITNGLFLSRLEMYLMEAVFQFIKIIRVLRTLFYSSRHTCLRLIKNNKRKLLGFLKL